MSLTILYLNIHILQEHMLNNFVIFGVPRCGSTHILQLLEQYLVKKYNVHREDENEFFNIFKKIPNNLYINHSIIKLHSFSTHLLSIVKVSDLKKKFLILCLL